MYIFSDDFVGSRSFDCVMVGSKGRGRVSYRTLSQRGGGGGGLELASWTRSPARQDASGGRDAEQRSVFRHAQDLREPRINRTLSTREQRGVAP